MKTKSLKELFIFRIILFFSLISFIGNAQVIQVEILGGSTVSEGTPVTIFAGNAIPSRITNISGNCDASTDVIIEVKQDPDFTFAFSINGDPEINVLGGGTSADIVASDQIEVMVDNDVTPRFTSTMPLNDGKWHQITSVYISGTIYLYIDGVLDKSEQNVTAPSPNFNRFAVGALYVEKNNISNPFLGEIDEVLWDQGFNEDQVHYLMNQEIERITEDFVNLKTVKGIVRRKIIM
jgi:hypothetical protein